MAFIVFVIAFFLASLIIILIMELKPLRHPSQRRFSKSSLLRILEDLTAVLFVLAFISVFLSWRISIIRTHPLESETTAGLVTEQTSSPSEIASPVPVPSPSPVSTESSSPLPSTSASPALPLQVTPEESELISRMDYNSENQLLTVTDKDGNVLLYRNVPENIWNDFSNSGSIDGYYLRIIKEKYPQE